MIRWLAVAAASLLLAACAATDTRSDTAGASASASSSQETLKQRAKQRWDYLINKQAAKAWDYLTPGYRATTTREKYAADMNNRPVQWESATIIKTDCAQADNCEVFVSVGYQVRIPGAGGVAHAFAPVQERWLLLHNQWYYLPSEGGEKVEKTK